MAKESSEKKAISITLNKDLIEKSKAKAKAESRSYSGYINNLIKEDLAKDKT